MVIAHPYRLIHKTPRTDRGVPFILVGAAGFEPTTSSTPLKRATKLRHAPNRWHCNREQIVMQPLGRLFIYDGYYALDQ